MDTLVSMRVFGAVAELKSFTAAADRLGLSPAMASKHVMHYSTPGLSLLRAIRLPCVPAPELMQDFDDETARRADKAGNVTPCQL